MQNVQAYLNNYRNFLYGDFSFLPPTTQKYINMKIKKYKESKQEPLTSMMTENAKDLQLEFVLNGTNK